MFCFGFLKACLGFFQCFGCNLFFIWPPLCVLCEFEIPFVHIVMAFTFQATFRGMSRVPTLMLASSPKLAKLLCFCRCFPFLCYPLVLSPLLLKVGFGFNLTSFQGCLRFVLCAFDYSTRFFEPSKMGSSRICIYPLIELLKIQWTNQHNSFSSCCHVGVRLYSKRLFKLARGLCPP